MTMPDDTRLLKIWALSILQAAARTPKCATLTGQLAVSVAAEKIDRAINELRAVTIPDNPIPPTLRPGA